MDRLPNELLLLVFAGIDNGHTMLHLSRVCKRWRRVSRDPRAWAGVRLEVHVMLAKDCNQQLVVSRREASVLQHAPTLRALLLHEPRHRHAGILAVVPLMAALAACTQPLTELHLGAEGGPGRQWSTSTSFAAIFGAVVCYDALSLTPSMVALMRRNRTTLRSAAVSLRGPQDLQHLALETLADTPALEELSLEVSNTFVYPNRELRGCVPDVRRLSFGAQRAAPQKQDFVNLQQNRLLKDLLRGASVSLREVRLAPGFELRQTTVKALGECGGLRVLAANMTALPAAITGGTLARLEELDVEVRHANQLPSGAQMLALDAADLVALRRLRFCIHKSWTPAMVRLLAALMRAAPGLTKLDLQCVSTAAAAMEADVAAELGRLVHLEEARFQDGGGALISVLAGLPVLRRVDGHFRVAGPDFMKCCGIVGAWPTTRPEITGHVKLSPLPMQSMEFHLKRPASSPLKA